MTTKTTDLTKQLGGLTLLALGFYLMGEVNLHIGMLQNLTLLVFSIAAAALIFGKSALGWFKKPQGKYIKIGLACLVLNTVWGFVGGIVIQLIFGMAGHHANSAFGNYSLLVFVPFMLMGEELFSISILETLRTKWKLSPLVASLITAAVFGLIHFSTYFGGDALRTVTQILLVQGAARLILNYAYLKTGSIWTPWAVHVVFDLVPLFLLPLILHK